MGTVSVWTAIWTQSKKKLPEILLMIVNTGEHNGDTIAITSSDENKNDATPKVCGEIEEKRAVEDKMPKSVGVLNLSMTAKEMRELILSRKKKDPRKERRKDMRKRVEMVEAM